jgi:hypothetical protein
LSLIGVAPALSIRDADAAATMPGRPRLAGAPTEQAPATPGNAAA